MWDARQSYPQHIVKGNRETGRGSDPMILLGAGNAKPKSMTNTQLGHTGRSKRLVVGSCSEINCERAKVVIYLYQ
jgi:hypothetical protein